MIFEETSTIWYCLIENILIKRTLPPCVITLGDFFTILAICNGYDVSPPETLGKLDVRITDDIHGG